MTDTRSFGIEISRKVLHLCTAGIPLAYAFVDDVDVMLWLLSACVVFAVAVELLRHNNARFQAIFRRWVGFMVRDGEWGRVCGATYVLVASLISIWLFPKPVAIAVLLILTVSDTAASLIGQRYGRTRFLGKSPAGSFAFFVTAVAILWVALPGSRGIAFTAAIVVTLAEALPVLKLGRFELNDNLTIPLLTGAVIHFLQMHVGQ